MFRLIAICVAIALIQTAHADTISNASSMGKYGTNGLHLEIVSQAHARL
jgi:hypothetical protein